MNPVIFILVQNVVSIVGTLCGVVGLFRLSPLLGVSALLLWLSAELRAAYAKAAAKQLMDAFKSELKAKEKKDV